MCIYSGLDRFVARSKLWEDLEVSGLAIKAEPYTLRVPRSQRGGEVLSNLRNYFIYATNALGLPQH